MKTNDDETAFESFRLEYCDAMRFAVQAFVPDNEILAFEERALRVTRLALESGSKPRPGDMISYLEHLAKSLYGAAFIEEGGVIPLPEGA